MGYLDKSVSEVSTKPSITFETDRWLSSPSIVTGIASVGTLVSYFPKERQKRSLHLVAKDIDWIGAVLLIVGITIL